MLLSLNNSFFAFQKKKLFLKISSPKKLLRKKRGKQWIQFTFCEKRKKAQAQRIWYEDPNNGYNYYFFNLFNNYLQKIKKSFWKKQKKDDL